MTTVGFTRPRDRIPESLEACRKWGFDALAAPSVEVVRGDGLQIRAAHDLVMSGLAYFTVFGSITAIDRCAEEYPDLGDMLYRTNIACTGPSTAERLFERTGHRADVVPEKYSGVGIAEALAGEVGGRTVVLMRSDSGDGKIVDMLEAAGAAVFDVAVYRLAPAEATAETETLMRAVMEGGLDALLMTSPMSARNFARQIRGRYGEERADAALEKVLKVAIGAPTCEAMKSLGIPADRSARVSTFDGMLAEVDLHIRRARILVRPCVPLIHETNTAVQGPFRPLPDGRSVVSTALVFLR